MCVCVWGGEAKYVASLQAEGKAHEERLDIVTPLNVCDLNHETFRHFVKGMKLVY